MDLIHGEISEIFSINVNNIIYKCTYKCITGWWFQPIWKILVSWDDYSQYMEKNVPNHQPDNMRSRTAFCFADMRLLVWTNVFHLSMLTIYGNVWWENDGKMIGKRWANDGKMIGKWWVAMNMWVCFQIYMASSDAAGIPHGRILGLFLKNDNASKLLGVLPLHHSGHEISHWNG